MKYLSFGSLNLDSVYGVDHIVAPGETVISSSLGRFFGGKGLNQSLSLARAGAEVWHAGMTGLGGEPLRELLEKNGVNISLLGTADCENGHAVILVDKSGQNSIITFAGSNSMITEKYILSVAEHFEKGDCVVLQNEINWVGEIVKIAKERGMTVALNPSPLNGKLDEIDFGLVDYLLLNEIEGKYLTGETEPKKIVRALKSCNSGMRIVLTLGSEGSMYYDGESEIFCPVYPVKVVDTTGAGDTFTGYFLFNVLSGMSPENALKLATKAAALAVSVKGAANSIPEMKDVMKLDDI